MDLKGKVAVITGAKGGLGPFVTERFLGAGARVLGISKKISSEDFAHPEFYAMPLDVLDGEAAVNLGKAALSKFQAVDILVHLVGGFAGGKPIPETEDETWQRMLDLNVRSFFNMLRAVVPHMRAAGYGRIVAVGSRAAVEPQANVAAYSASKAALVSMVRSAAAENKDAGITANAILPGTMDTPTNRAANPAADPSRWVSPAKVAGLALWLCSAEASEVSGAAIPVYGREA